MGTLALRTGFRPRLPIAYAHRSLHRAARSITTQHVPHAACLPILSRFPNMGSYPNKGKDTIFGRLDGIKDPDTGEHAGPRACVLDTIQTLSMPLGRILDSRGTSANHNLVPGNTQIGTYCHIWGVERE